MTEFIKKLEEICSEKLRKVNNRLIWKIDISLDEWFKRLRLFENTENLSPILAEEMVRYISRTSLILFRQAELSMTTMEKYKYVGGLNYSMKKLLKEYPGVLMAAKRIK